MIELLQTLPQLLQTLPKLTQALPEPLLGRAWARGRFGWVQGVTEFTICCKNHMFWKKWNSSPDHPDQVSSLRLETSLPHAPGVRMTWVLNKLPQIIILYYHSIILLYYYITILLYYYIIILLYYYIIILLYYYVIILLYYYIIILYYYIIALLY